MKDPRYSPQKVAALRALSTVRYMRQPEGVRLTTLIALHRDRLISWTVRGKALHWRRSPVPR